MATKSQNQVPVVEPVGATHRVMAAVRELIVRRQLSPGQQVNQAQLAQRIGVSRIPVREALRGLQVEGLVSHEPNRGYFVTTLDADELEQIYLMRRVLETEVLLTVAWPTSTALQNLKRMNREIELAMSRDAVNRSVELNRAFHFALFQMSSLKTVILEIERLWGMSDHFRAFYLTEEAARRRVVLDHRKMIDAIHAHDRARLIGLADRHRAAAETRVLALLRDGS
jgi:DNA-binding GntR family transcriptional regulator